MGLGGMRPAYGCSGAKNSAGAGGDVAASPVGSAAVKGSGERSGVCRAIYMAADLAGDVVVRRRQRVGGE